MRRSESPVGVFIELISLFLTAKPTPCCRGCSGSRPFQKKVKFFSLRDQQSAILVSSKATMSRCSLCSSLSLTAVFLICPSRMSMHAVVSRLSSDVPGSEPDRCFFLFESFGPEFTSAFRLLIYLHELSGANGYGGLAPYWPVAAKLRRAVTNQCNSTVAPTIGSNPWRSSLRQFGELTTRNCHFRVVPELCPRMECPLHGRHEPL